MAKPRVLVCEDEYGVRAAIRLVLEQEYELVFAEDGEQALQRATTEPALDLILLDIKMPKRDGLEILKTLMTRPIPPRVIMLTAYQSIEVAQRAIELGAIDYVPKPFERQELAHAVQRALALPDWQQPIQTSDDASAEP